MVGTVRATSLLGYFRPSKATAANAASDSANALEGKSMIFALIHEY